MKNKGMKLGSVVYERARGCSATKLYMVTKLSSDVTLSQVCNYGAEKTVLKLAAEVMLANWMAFKGDPVVLMAKSQCKYTWKYDFEAVKCKLYQALLFPDATAMVHEVSRTISCYKKPDASYSTRKIPKGALTLVPLAPLSNITSKESANSISLGKHLVCDEEVDVFVSPAPKPSFVAEDPATVAPDASQIALGGSTPLHRKKKQY